MENKLENSKKVKLLILDTNVILSDSSCIYNFEENDVIIPIQVLEELDTFKKGNEMKNFHAREFIRNIDNLSTDTIFNGGISIGKDLGTIRIALSIPWEKEVKKNLRVRSVDNSIINLAYHLKKTENREIILISKDVNLRLKAKALKIVAQDYLQEVILDTGFLNDKILTKVVPNEVVNALYRDNQIEYKINGEKINQNFIFQSDSNKSKTVLVRNLGIFYKTITKKNLVAYKIQPKNAEQAFAMDALFDPKISVVAIEGKAGTGKTIISLAAGLDQLDKNKFSKIYFTRQTISVGKEVGFLPGDISQKIDPYMNGMKDNLSVISSKNTKNGDNINKYLRLEDLLVEPLNFIRGRSLNNIYFIVDEAQNLTPHEIKTLVTRAGEGTKFIFIGDTNQIDDPYLDQRSNGFTHLIDRFKNQQCFCYVHLVKGERSPLAELAGKIL